MADDPDARPEFAEVEAQCRALAAMLKDGSLAAGADAVEDVTETTETSVASPAAAEAP
jgi:hypothetical protein